LSTTSPPLSTGFTSCSSKDFLLLVAFFRRRTTTIRNHSPATIYYIHPAAPADRRQRAPNTCLNTGSQPSSICGPVRHFCSPNSPDTRLSISIRPQPQQQQRRQRATVCNKHTGRPQCRRRRRRYWVFAACVGTRGVEMPESLCRSRSRRTFVG